MSAALIRRSVKIAVFVADQRAHRLQPVLASCKAVKNSLITPRVDHEYHSVAEIAAGKCGSVKIALRITDETCNGIPAIFPTGKLVEVRLRRPKNRV